MDLERRVFGETIREGGGGRSPARPGRASRAVRAGLIYSPREFSRRAKILDAVDQMNLAQHLTMLAPARPGYFQALVAAGQAALSPRAILLALGVACLGVSISFAHSRKAAEAKGPATGEKARRDGTGGLEALLAGHAVAASTMSSAEGGGRSDSNASGGRSNGNAFGGGALPRADMQAPRLRARLASSFSAKPPVAPAEAARARAPPSGPAS